MVCCHSHLYVMNIDAKSSNVDIYEDNSSDRGNCFFNSYHSNIRFTFQKAGVIKLYIFYMGMEGGGGGVDQL